MPNDPSLDELEQYSETLILLHDWSVTAIGVAEALANGGPPPPFNPNGLATPLINGRIAQVEAAVRSVSAPMFERVETTGRLPSSYDELRDHLRTLVISAESAWDELEAQANRRQVVIGMRESAVSADAALDVLATALERLIETIPVEVVNNALRGDWLDIRQEYQPALARVRDATRGAENILTAAINTRRVSLTSEIDELISQLAVEQKALEGAVATLHAAWQEIEALERQLALVSHGLERLRRGIESLRDRMQEHRDEVSELRNRAHREANEASSVRQRKNEWMQGKRDAWRCPDNATYTTCRVHPEIRTAFDRNLVNSNAAKSFDREARAHEERASDFRRQCEPHEREIGRIGDEIAEATTRLNEEQDDYNRQRQEFARRRSAALEEQHRVRALVHVNESQQDRSHLSVLAERIGQMS